VPNSKLESKYADGWKRAITCLFFAGGFNFPHGRKRSEDLILIKEDCDTYNPKQGLSLPYFAMYIRGFEIKYQKGQEDAVYHTVSEMYSYLNKLGLVDTSEVNAEMYFVTLNSKGVDVALKLQEHDDNKERFKQQSAISKVIQDNSSKSVTTARIALGVAAIVMVSAISSAAINYIRLDKLEQKILSHDAIELHIRSNEAKINELSTKGAPVDSQVASIEEVQPRSEMSK
jgi:hypothetical protein